MTDGETVEEVMANAREAIALYLDGETPESPTAAGARLDAQTATVGVDVCFPDLDASAPGSA